MPGRKFKQANSSYRYGFNGQEKSDEIAAGLTTAMYWEYDSRTGRRWNLDPVPKIGESEYTCFGGNPIYLGDALGNDPDPPSKNTKGYDYAGAMRSACIHFLAARVAFFTYEVRLKREQCQWKLNDAYRQAANNFSVIRYQEDNVSNLGIDQAAFTKIVSEYYIKFEKSFNYAANETVEKLGAIFYAPSESRNIFKPNLTTTQAHDAIAANIKLLDDMCDEANTIAAKWQEVLDKCFMWTAVWACSGIGSGVGFSGIGGMPGLAQINEGYYSSTYFRSQIIIPNQGFRSFSAFKRAMGPAGKGQVWHHIVEQTDANVARFGAESIHNTGNLIRLPHGAGTIHARVSGYYSSIQPFTNGQTVRQWLSTQSYEAQYNFGIQTIQKFNKIP